MYIYKEIWEIIFSSNLRSSFGELFSGIFLIRILEFWRALFGATSGPNLGT